MSSDDALRKQIADALAAKHGAAEVRVSQWGGMWGAIAHIQTPTATATWNVRERHVRKRDALHALAAACGVDGGIDALAVLYAVAPKCDVCREHVATRTVTLRRVCDRIACTLGLPVSGDLPHAETLRAANDAHDAKVTK